MGDDIAVVERRGLALGDAGGLAPPASESGFMVGAVWARSRLGMTGEAWDEPRRARVRDDGRFGDGALRGGMGRVGDGGVGGAGSGLMFSAAAVTFRLGGDWASGRLSSVFDACRIHRRFSIPTESSEQLGVRIWGRSGLLVLRPRRGDAEYLNPWRPSAVSAGLGIGLGDRLRLGM